MSKNEIIEIAIKFLSVLIPSVVGVVGMLYKQKTINEKVENHLKDSTERDKLINAQFKDFGSLIERDRKDREARENSFTGAVNSIRQQFKGVETSIGKRLDGIEKDISAKIHSMQLDIAKNHLNKNDKREILDELDKFRVHVSDSYLKKENADVRYNELRNRLEGLEKRSIRS